MAKYMYRTQVGIRRSVYIQITGQQNEIETVYMQWMMKEIEEKLRTEKKQKKFLS